MHDQLTTIDQLSQLMDPDLHLHLEKLESTNFFFFFRMLIVWFKREFEWSDLLRLWEVLWTDFLSSSFHMFITLAILEKHRDPILNHLQHADELLKYSMSFFNHQTQKTRNVSKLLTLSPHLLTSRLSE